MEGFTIRPIARMKSDFVTKFGIPRQAGIVAELESLIVFEPEYREAEALRGIEEFSHLWLIWQFSGNLREGWSPTVRPPRLGGNVRKGVFATRSPFRPNSLGLSCVRLIGVEDSKDGKCLRVAGADLMDDTPIFDIKPYVPYADCKPEALSGFAPDGGRTLKVAIPEEIKRKIPETKFKAIEAILANDPRPRYQHDAERIYVMEYANFELKFSADNENLYVKEIKFR